MAATVEITLTSTWQAAGGTGKAIVSPPTQGCLWAVAPFASPPTMEGGHTLLPPNVLDRTQAAGETLFLKGSGKAYVTRDAAPA